METDTDSDAKAALGKPPVVAAPTKKRGRKPAEFWVSFTTMEEPYKARAAPCRHCQRTVSYHKKWEQAKCHLMKCEPYLLEMRATAPEDRPEWFMTELEKRRRTSTKTLPLDMLREDAVLSDMPRLVARQAEAGARPKAKRNGAAGGVGGVTAAELLLLQAVRQGTEIDKDLFTHVLAQESHQWTSRDAVMVAYDRVYRAVQRKLKQVRHGATLIAKWDAKDEQLGLWLATGDSCYFLKQTTVTKSEDELNSISTSDSHLGHHIQDVARRVAQGLPCIVKRCVVDAPANVLNSITTTVPADPLSLEYRPSLKRAIVELVERVLRDSSGPSKGEDDPRPFRGMLEAAVFYRDILAACGSDAQASSPHSCDDALCMLNADTRIFVDATRSITTREAVQVLITAEELVDREHVLFMLQTHCKEEDVERLTQVLFQGPHHSLLPKYHVCLKAFIKALQLVTRTVVRPSDVVVAFASIQHPCKSDDLNQDEKAYLTHHIQEIEALCSHPQVQVAHLLDPAYFGEFLDTDTKMNAEAVLLGGVYSDSGTSSEEDREALYMEYTQFQLAAAQLREIDNGFVSRMLKERKKTVVQYWLTDGARWPRLQAIALSVEQPPIDASARALAGAGMGSIFDSVDAAQKTFVATNAPQLNVEDLFAAAGTDESIPV